MGADATRVPFALESALSVFCGFLCCVLSLLVMSMGSFAKIESMGADDEIQRLQKAYDAICTLRSSPGTAETNQLKLIICAGGKRSCREKAATLVDCLATVSYVGLNLKPNGSASAKVFAGYNFHSLSHADAEKWCKETLVGTWPNMMIDHLFPGDQETLSAEGVEIPVTSGWTCGDRGWVGCNGEDCVHGFGQHPTSGYTSWGGKARTAGDYYATRYALEVEPCLVSTSGAEVVCSIDEEGQVRLGTTAELLAKAENEKGDAQKGHTSFKETQWFLFSIGLCCCCGAVAREVVRPKDSAEENSKTLQSRSDPEYSLMSLTSKDEDEDEQ